MSAAWLSTMGAMYWLYHRISERQNSADVRRPLYSGCERAQKRSNVAAGLRGGRCHAQPQSSSGSSAVRARCGVGSISLSFRPIPK